MLVVSFPGRADWTITPSITVRETYSDNVRLAPRGLEQDDFVTEVSPRIRILGKGARAKLSLDYARQDILYAGGASGNRLQNQLNGTGSVEAIEKFFFIDAKAIIAQTTVSAFGPQYFTNANVTANRTETRAYSLSPYIRSTFGDVASYELRDNYTKSSANTSLLANNYTNEWIGQVRSLTSYASFGWGLDYNRRRTNYSGANNLESDLARGLLFYNVDPQLKLSANAGRETNNYTLATQSRNIRGFGFDWNPTDRTKISAERNRRFFGNGYAYKFDHRTPLSAWNLSYVRDVATIASQLLADVPSTAYVLLSALYDSENPNADPLVRDSVVRNALALLGLPATSGPLTFITNRAFVDRRLQGSFSLTGARNTVTFTVFRSQREAVSTAPGVDDFSSFLDFTQRGLSANWSLKLSGISSLNLLASQTRSVGTGTTTLGTNQKLMNLIYSRQFGPKTTGSLALRQVRVDSEGGATSAYRENSLTGTLSVSF